ncbi:MAG: DUF2155 domain-containing protein [Pseudomonadota bacterium]
MRAAALALMLAATPVAAQSTIEQTPLDPQGQGLSQDEDRALDALPTQEPAQMVDAGAARLRGLDTLTNTVNDFRIGVGETLGFKRLIVTLEACRHPEGDPGADAYAFLRIRDRRETEDRFSGWMLASSPALSALDHPRYDVWVLNCITE